MGMETQSTGLKILPRTNYPCRCTLTKLLSYLLILLPILIILHFQASPLTYPSFPSSPSWPFSNICNPTNSSHSRLVETLTAKLKDLVTFLPLKDLRYSKTPMGGNTWFMSSLTDTFEENEPGYLYFPSNSSKGRVLCIKGRNTSDGTKNSYALAWTEALPPSATLLPGLTFVSDTYFNHKNLWHGLCAITPFVSWSIKNQCEKPSRWVLYKWGELTTKMGSWVWNFAKASFGDIEIEKFGKGDGPYCFKKAVVMRHDIERIGEQKKLRVFDLLRCKARKHCGMDPFGRRKDMNERGVPIIRLTCSSKIIIIIIRLILLMRRGARSFKNAEVVKGIVGKECQRVEGCVLSVIQSEDLSFCDQVRAMTNADILVSPHGAQHTNMLFMDRGSSVMEFFPKGWLETAGTGQYVFLWMANQRECFLFHKNNKVGHNETYFAEWARKVLNDVRVTKLEQASKEQARSSACECKL